MKTVDIVLFFFNVTMLSLTISISIFIFFIFCCLFVPLISWPPLLHIQNQLSGLFILTLIRRFLQLSLSLQAYALLRFHNFLFCVIAEYSYLITDAWDFYFKQKDSCLGNSKFTNNSLNPKEVVRHSIPTISQILTICVYFYHFPLSLGPTVKLFPCNL